jgi:hypothetical protein
MIHPLTRMVLLQVCGNHAMKPRRLMLNLDLVLLLVYRCGHSSRRSARHAAGTEKDFAPKGLVNRSARDEALWQALAIQRRAIADTHNDIPADDQ